MTLELLRAIQRAGWSLETLCCGRRLCACAEPSWRVLGEDGDVLEEVLDSAVEARLLHFFGGLWEDGLENLAP